MSYDNFKPTIWSGIMLHECKEKSVYRADCWEEFTGEIKKAGDEIVFSSVASPSLTHKDTSVDGTNPDVPNLEEPDTTALHMKIQQLDMFNFGISDIDQMQTQGDLLKRMISKTNEAIASAHDRHIALQAKNATNMFGSGTTKKVVTGTASSGEINVLDLLDDMAEKMSLANVGEGAKIVLNCSYKFFKLLRKALREVDTDNSSLIENGRFRRVNDIIIKPSVNCAVETIGGNACDHLFLRTNFAVGFADGMERLVPYQPEKKLGDAVKGASLYQAKILLPGECFDAPVYYS